MPGDNIPNSNTVAILGTFAAMTWQQPLGEWKARTRREGEIIKWWMTLSRHLVLLHTMNDLRRQIIERAIHELPLSDPASFPSGITPELVECMLRGAFTQSALTMYDGTRWHPADAALNTLVEGATAFLTDHFPRLHLVSPRITQEQMRSALEVSLRHWFGSGAIWLCTDPSIPESAISNSFFGASPVHVEMVDLERGTPSAGASVSNAPPAWMPSEAGNPEVTRKVWQSPAAKLVPTKATKALIISSPTSIEDISDKELLKAIQEAKAASREKSRQDGVATGPIKKYQDYDRHMDRYIQWNIWRYEQQREGKSTSKYEFLKSGINMHVVNGSTWPADLVDRRDEYKLIMDWLHRVEGGRESSN